MYRALPHISKRTKGVARDMMWRLAAFEDIEKNMHPNLK
jgi:hypothetical protein